MKNCDLQLKIAYEKLELESILPSHVLHIAVGRINFPRLNQQRLTKAKRAGKDADE